jgi:hypothetical protein
MLARRVMTLWLMIWMLVVPLFHVHPEADHHHGDGDHVHGGTIHTVFSPDLQCEYVETIHDVDCPDVAHEHLQTSASSGHSLNHPEIDFALQTVPFDRPLQKPGLAIFELPVVESSPVRGDAGTASWQPGISLSVLYVTTAVPPRAPPFQSL